VLFRRDSRWGFAALALAAFVIFVPVASVSGLSRPHQTLTIVALVFGLALTALVWLALRQRGIVRSSYLGVAALVGSLSSVWLLRVLPGVQEAQRRELASRLLVISLLYAVGIWLFAVGARRAFPRPNRGGAIAGVGLALVGLLLWPSLLVQPGVDVHHIGDIELQLRAGYRYWTVGAVLLVAPFLALCTLPGDWFERWWARLTTAVMSLDRRVFAVGLVIVAGTIAIALSIYSFDRRPTTADEIAQLWHARMLLSGHLALPPDPNAEFFAIDNIIDRPVWMSQFPIGGPAVLALGLAVNAAWLLNPVLTALLALNVYRFAQRAYGEAQARAAAAVLVTSPMILIMGATHMNHTPTALLVSISLASLPLWSAAREPDRLRRSAALIGLGIGAAATIRPLDGVIAGVVFGLLMLAQAARSRVHARSLPVAVAAAAIPVALLLAANAATTGHPLRFGYELLWGANHSLGLHDDPTGNPHTPWRAMLLIVKYAAQVNWIGTAWPIPVLLLVAAGLALARRPNRWDVLLLGLFCAQLVTYGFYWHDGQFVGPRFLFSAIPALLVLAARAPFIAGERLRSGVWWRIAMLVIPVCIGVAWLQSMRPFGMQALAAEFRESRTRLKVDPPEEVRSGAQRNVLVFVQEGASSRLLHRLWGLGLSRPDASRLLVRADGCSLYDAIAMERPDTANTAALLARLEAKVRPFERRPDNPRLPDAGFHVTDSSSISERCAREIAHDYHIRNTVAYGPMLLENRLDDSGRVAGPAVYVMDLGTHNEVLRARFGDRRWVRYEVPRSRAGTVPVLVPYDSGR
jgi:hypothetical protein